jgi:hypothetical protein
MSKKSGDENTIDNNKPVGSSNNSNSNEPGDKKNNNNKTNARDSSPNPFLNYLSLSPNNLSPRSDTSGPNSATVSPRSPRFQTEFFQNGIRIPPTTTTTATTATTANGHANGLSTSPLGSSILTAASPPRFATIEQFMTAANAVQNMALAHEISVNQNFKLEKLEYDPHR